MNQLLAQLKNNTLLFLILFLSLILRLAWLDKFPIGITNDELHFVLNSKAIYLWGANLAHNWNPLSLTPIPHETSSELTYLIVMPLIGPLPLSLFNARLPFVIISLLTNLTIFFLVKKLLNKSIGLAASFSFAINPWSIYVARTSFDAPIALFGFLLSLLMLLSVKGWKILLCFIPLALAFYTYIGTKIIFPLFVLITIFYCFNYHNHGRYLKQYLILILLCLIVVCQYSLNISHSSSGSRLSEFAIFNSDQISSQVNNNRALSINTPINQVFDNKVTIFLNNFIIKYIGNFSTGLLFIMGDQTQKITLSEIGYFYYFSSIFLIVGLIKLPQKYPKVFLLLVGILIISPLPEALRSDRLPAYAFHSVLMYPVLTIIIGFGMITVIQLINNHSKKVLYFLILTFIIVTQVLYFIYIYFLRYPVYNSEAFNFSYREVDYYINHEVNRGRQVYVVTPEPQTLFKSYIFYNNLLNKSNIRTISKIYSSDPEVGLNLGNIHFISKLNSIPLNLEVKPQNNDPTIIIQTSTGSILDKFNRISIAQLSDGSEIFGLYNGQTCTNLTLSKYPNNFTINDFNLESIPVDEFCQKFISKLN